METIQAESFAEFTSKVADAIAAGKDVCIAGTAADGVWTATTYTREEFDG